MIVSNKETKRYIVQEDICEGLVKGQVVTSVDGQVFYAVPHRVQDEKTKKMGLVNCFANTISPHELAIMLKTGLVIEDLNASS